MGHTIIVTGGAGFIGSAVVRRLIRSASYRVVNVDKLTYAGNLETIADVADDPRYVFEQHDITDAAAMGDIFERYRPHAVLHLAAESHVDRSIEGPAPFIQTNIVGTFVLLNEALRHQCRFVHVSTDEVFGSLGPTGRFTNETPYDPRSPYSASKAASDHLVRAWHHTYGLSAIITNCSNNYGPFQYPEKLIPTAIIKALRDEPIPVYGKGENVRDWLYVEDHAEALHTVLEEGKPGNTYLLGGNNEKRNVDVVRAICDVLGKPYSLIEFVQDRPGHDLRYAIEPTEELDWKPRESFESGLRKTVEWYLNHEAWWTRLYDGKRRGVLAR